MSILLRISKRLFPDLVAPPSLNGLPPSLSGIFRRILQPTRIIKHPIYGEYRVTAYSRDEWERVIAHNHAKMMKKYSDQHTWVEITDVRPNEAVKIIFHPKEKN
jgi:hypothetical protein